MDSLTKFLWLDCETTDLDYIAGTVHQVAGEVVINGQTVDSFNYEMAPHPEAHINPESLQVSFPDMGEEEVVEMVKARQLTSAKAYDLFNKKLCKYVNKYDKKDKFVFAAYNANFDAQHINAWFNRHGNPYFFGLCHGGAYLDPLNLALLYEMKQGRIVFSPNRKLTTVCDHFGVELENAHDALADIRATRKVAKILWEGIQK